MAEEDKKSGVDRRTFLKTAAASAGVAAASVTAAASAAGEAANAAKDPKDTKAAPASEGAHDLVVARPGSDFMVDVIKTLGLDYMSTNPGSSFRSVHESLINYGGNTRPELLTCTHEEAAIALAHGYSKAAGKPMGVIVHGTVGLQHGSMALYNAWVDRVPIMLFAGNGSDAAKRRPGTEWCHSVQDPALLVRDFVKWDDYPASLQHFAESTVHAYKIATTPPMEPVMITADMDLQEEGIRERDLSIPRLARSIPAQGDRAALAEAAKWLVEAKNPMIVADRCARTPEGIALLIALAEALQAPVVDLGGRMNFPNTHPLHQLGAHSIVREADVVLMLEVADPFGVLYTVDDPSKKLTRLAPRDTRVINISMQDVFLHSNYQDFQRYLPADLAINGDAQSSLPALTDEVRRLLTDERKRAFAQRGAKWKQAHDKGIERAREAAALGWDLSPITTPRMAMELWAVIRNEPWSLAVSDRINAPRELWTITEYHQALGGSGAQGVGYCAPGSVGVALANKAKGLLTVTFQPDGDLMYSPGVLWTAAHHRIPILFVMFNNRAYHHETMHVQHMAGMHDRRPDTAWLGTTLRDPFIDYAKLAQGLGVWAEGPIEDPAQLGPAFRRAVDVVKGGTPALVDVVCQGV